MGRNRSPSPTPAGGPVAKPEITRSGRVTPLLAPGKRGWPPTSLGRGAWGVTTLSANLAGDDSWVAGWDRAGNSQRAPSAEASDLGALPFGRRPQPPLSCNPLLNHALRFGAFLDTSSLPMRFHLFTHRSPLPLPPIGPISALATGRYSPPMPPPVHGASGSR